MNKICYLTVCYINYDLILLQIDNFKKLFGDNFNLVIIDNTPDGYKNNDLIDLIKSKNNITFYNKHSDINMFDGVSHGSAIDFGVEKCHSEIICIFDSDFFFINKNIENDILNYFEKGYIAIGCEFNDGTNDSTKYIDLYPEYFENAPVCYACFYKKDIIENLTFQITNDEVDANRNLGYIETGWRVRKHIVDNSLKSLTWKAERNKRPCFFKNGKGELIGFHYVAASHYNRNQDTLNHISKILNEYI